MKPGKKKCHAMITMQITQRGRYRITWHCNKTAAMDNSVWQEIVTDNVTPHQKFWYLVSLAWSVFSRVRMLSSFLRTDWSSLLFKFKVSSNLEKQNKVFISYLETAYVNKLWHLRTRPILFLQQLSTFFEGCRFYRLLCLYQSAGWRHGFPNSPIWKTPN